MLRRLGRPLDLGAARYLRRRLEHHRIDVSHFENEPLPPRPRRSYPEESLREAARRSRCMREMIEWLGAPTSGSVYTYLRKRAEHFAIDLSHFAEDRVIGAARLREAVSNSTSVAATLRALGLPVTSANRARVKREISRHGLSTAHFTGRGHRRGQVPGNRLTADQILVKREAGASRTRRVLLHRALQEKSVPYACVVCGTGDRWRGRPLVLEIDHVNGDPLDNRIGNLRYLCPSCHSQTPTHARPARSGAPRVRGTRARPVE